MIKVRLQGPIALYTGYSQGFIPMVREIAKRGEMDFELKAIRNTIPDGTAKDIKQMLDTRKDYGGVGVLTGFPTFLGSLGTRYKVVYTMYETDDIPFDWKSEVEKASEVWVPSTFCGRLFGKYNPRIRLVRWGVNEKVFKPMKKVEKDPAVFRFGAVGVQGKRKGTDVLIKAFNRAFRGSSGVRLTIKTRDTKWLPEFNNPMIDVVDTDWPEKRLVQFYNEIDCLVSPSRGEGISMAPLQAVMCKTPALVTNWSGPVDYIKDDGVWGIRIKGLVRTDSMEAKGTNWAEPDDRHLAQLMQWAVETRPKVTGDYSLWTTGNMATEFTNACTLAWRRCYGNSN
jgi:glycosyltransferase involved in cell wall biosynthesis